MKEKFVRTVRKAGKSLAVCIPKEIIQLLDVSEGDIVRIEVEKVEK